MPQRWLKPGIRTSEKWNGVSFEAQSLYVRLMTLVDDYGRYDGRPSVLAGECFAVWNDQNPSKVISVNTVSALCQQLADKNLIDIYETGGPKPKRFLQLTNWTERTRTESRWPDPAKCQQRVDTMSAPCALPPPSPSPSSTSPPGGTGGASPPNEIKGVVTKQFKKPSLDEVKLQAAKIGLPEDQCVHFLNYYEANGWRVGRNPMKSWTAALTNWNLNFRNGTYSRKSKALEAGSRQDLRTKEIKGLVDSTLKEIRNYETP